MKPLIRMTILILSSFGCCCGTGIAAEDSFEINLKELSPAKAQHRTGTGIAAQDSFEINLKDLAPAKAQHRTRQHVEAPKRQIPPEAGQTTESSIYTIRPGDHLFLILIRSYGLSNKAAEQLIPEVMRLNGISNTHGLTVGQRLTIPLPTPHERPSKVARRKTQDAVPVPAQPQTQQAAASEPAAARLEQPAPAQLPAEPSYRQLTVSAAAPCPLAHAIVEQLGLLAPQILPMPGEGAFTAASAGLRTVIACGLSSAEAYTYERLLTRHGAQLLIFNGNEPYRRVVEMVANNLGLSYRPADPDAVRELPLTYIFSAFGPNGQDVHLTINPAAQ